MRFEDLAFGQELPEHAPDVGAEAVRRFTRTARMDFPRFYDSEAARREGLPGAIVPGIMSQGILAALIHRFAPEARILEIDTTFRAPVLVGSKPVCRGVVTHLDPASRIAEIDLTLVNEAGETRVIGTAKVALP
jgi:acyl dehydratase